MVSFTPPAFNSREKRPPYLLFRRMSVPQSWSRRCGEEKVCLCLPGNEAPSLCHPARSLVTITVLFQTQFRKLDVFPSSIFYIGGKVSVHLGLLKRPGFDYSPSLMCITAYMLVETDTVSETLCLKETQETIFKTIAKFT
jgi:hypothetical protein